MLIWHIQIVINQISFFLGLQNDHKALMTEIENSLHTLHANAKLEHERDDASTKAAKQVVSMSSPFAFVDTVIQGSPAFQGVSSYFQSTFHELYSHIV